MNYESGLLSILIVNWKSKDFVRKCLRAIEATCADLRLQIVVVDGGSFDGCGDMLAAEFPSVEFVQSPENVGFGRSNNLGFQQVRGEYVLLLNPDTELQPNSVQALLQALKTLPRAAMVGPRLHNPDGSLQKSSVMAFPTPLNQALRSEFLMKVFPRSRLWGSGQAYAASDPTPVEAISGACMLLRSETYRSVEGFHPAYFMYAEDMDLCYRIHHRIGGIYHVPKSIVTHFGGGSSSTQVNHFSILKLREATETYFRLNHNEATVAKYRTLQITSSLFRLFLLTPLLLLHGTKIQEKTMISIKRWGTILKWASKTPNNVKP